MVKPDAKQPRFHGRWLRENRRK